MLSNVCPTRPGRRARRWLGVLDLARDGIELPLRAGRYVVDGSLRAKALDSLERRWRSRSPLRTRDAPDLPHLDWLLGRLGVAVPAPEVARLLGGVLTRRGLEEYQRLIEPLRAAASRPRVGAVRRGGELETGSRRRLPRLRLLFVCGEFPNPVNGGGRRVSDFIRELSARHDVFVAAWRVRRRDQEAFRALAPYCRKLVGFCLEDLERGCSRRILDFLGGRPADVVHYEWPRSLASFDRRLGRFHVYTHMEVVSLSLAMDLRRLEPLSPQWCARLALIPKMLGLEVLQAARADREVTVTARDGEFLAGFRPDAVYSVINHGLNLEESGPPESQPETATVVFAGNFRHRPNQDAAHFFMRRIEPLVSAAVRDLRVLLVGADPPRDIRGYHDGRKVVVTGEVPDVRPYILRGAVCIAPLVSGAGQRTKVIQYASVCRPSVVTPLAAEDLLFEEGTEIAVAAEPEAFAARLTELLLHPERASAMAARARARARACYDNRRIVREGLEGIYRELYAGPHVAPP